MKPLSQVPSEVDRGLISCSSPCALLSVLTHPSTHHLPAPEVQPRILACAHTHTCTRGQHNSVSLAHVPKTKFTFLSPTGALLFLLAPLSVPTPHSHPHRSLKASLCYWSERGLQGTKREGALLGHLFLNTALGAKIIWQGAMTAPHTLSFPCILARLGPGSGREQDL